MFVLRFVKSLNKVANQNRIWDRLFCIANLGLYKGCWEGEIVALSTQARIQAGLQAWARSKVSWLHHQTGANPSPGSSKRGTSTLKLQLLIPSSGIGQKWTVKERGGLASKPAGTKLETPYFSSSARQPNPIFIQGDKKQNKTKAHATHSHALVGNWEKFICVNRSNRKQQNPPACPQDTLESGMSQSVRGQSREREDALAGKSAGQCRGGSI